MLGILSNLRIRMSGQHGIFGNFAGDGDCATGDPCLDGACDAGLCAVVDVCAAGTSDLRCRCDDGSELQHCSPYDCGATAESIRST